MPNPRSILLRRSARLEPASRQHYPSLTFERHRRPADLIIHLHKRARRPPRVGRVQAVRLLSAWAHHKGWVLYALHQGLEEAGAQLVLLDYGQERQDGSVPIQDALHVLWRQQWWVTKFCQAR